MSILVTGAKGQLGQELTSLLDEKGVSYLATDAAELDITDRQAVQAYFKARQPQFVFHCAAYTAVDPAEDEGKQANWAVNVDGTRNIAEAAEAAGATLVYISTDYVFDGTKTDVYTVEDEPNPQNEYGRAKLAGGRAVEEFCSHSYIIRTSWVFGQYGKNFVYTMLRLAETHPVLTVVNDQIGRPTWTRTLAEFMVHVYETRPAFGIYHLSNEGSCSWHEFASEILKDKAVEVKPVTSAEYPQKAHRPKHSVMDLSKAESTGFSIPSWQEALRQFLQKIQDPAKEEQ